MNNNNINKNSFRIKLLIFLLFNIIIQFHSTAQTTVNYTESTEIIANPERGLQKYSITNNNYNSSTNYSNLNQNTLTGWRTGTDKVTVIFRYFLLSAFMNTDISAIYLNNIQLDFDIIRASGLKCIVRFSYSNAQSSSVQQPAKSQILKHIVQIADLLARNQDIILTHQAGFLGTWGEWYYTNSTEFGTEGTISTTQWANRKEIIDAMLQATPSGIPLQVRYPEIKKKLYGNTGLNEQTAYQSTPQARIGFFNDAFLNNWGDMGTYSVSSQNTNPVGTADYIYLSNETKFTPMTGETNGLNPPRTNGENAVIEMNTTNWSTLNRDYYTQNFNNWISSGHYPEILRNLGYRFVLKQGNFSISDNTLNMNLKIINTGYARLFKARNVKLILRNNTTGTDFPTIISTDPRTWSDSVYLNHSVDLANLPEGSYSCFLFMPDPDKDISGRPEYCIRFSNENLWSNSDGKNKLQFGFNWPVTTSNPELFTVNPTIEVLYIADGKIRIRLNNTNIHPAILTLTDIHGRVIKQIQVTLSNIHNEKIFHISNISRGFYLLTYSDEVSKQTVKVLI